MTDKEKIREEVARIQLYSQSEVLKQILDFIDSLQEEPSIPEIVDEHYWEMLGEEPVSDTQSPVIFYGLTGSVGSLKEEPVSEQNLSNVQRTTKNWKEPVSEELEKAAKHNTFKYVFDKNVKETLISELKYIGDNSFKDGAKWQITKLMKDATEAVVAIDSGGYPYIDKTIELYDYDKDVPLAKKGDKYKVILIKEDE